MRKNKPIKNYSTFSNDEIENLWKESEPWQRACTTFWERLTTTISKQENPTYKEN